mmetsp:Transcript_117711/g.313137  ORF Transcript_117711/g.313137 Transcript_117711/m.313137 type:complete len:210 (-) Transcript_117711:758-1387(-)
MDGAGDNSKPPQHADQCSSGSTCERTSKAHAVAPSWQRAIPSPSVGGQQAASITARPPLRLPQSPHIPLQTPRRPPRCPWSWATGPRRRRPAQRRPRPGRSRSSAASSAASADSAASTASASTSTGRGRGGITESSTSEPCTTSTEICSSRAAAEPAQEPAHCNAARMRPAASSTIPPKPGFDVPLSSKRRWNSAMSLCCRCQKEALAW